MGRHKKTNETKVLQRLVQNGMAAVILAGTAGCIKINITPASDDEGAQVETDEILGGWTPTEITCCGWRTRERPSDDRVPEIKRQRRQLRRL